MKCIITGHTKGIGKFLYEYFLKQGFVVEGISRSNGFDISKNYKEVLEKIKDNDLFFNNAYCEDYQSRLLIDTNNKVKNIISIGSTAGYYSDIDSKKHQYSINKKKINRN